MNHSPADFNERVLLTIFALFGVPRSLLDVGSGSGDMVMLARRMGVRAYGVDIAPPAGADPLIFSRHDLRQRFEINLPYAPSEFDMVICLETAEHIPAASADNLVWTITKHSAVNGRLVFSSALPGQGGEGHVNLQPPTYWRKKLWDIGRFSYRAEATAQLALLLTYTAGPMANWIPANIQVF